MISPGELEEFLPFEFTYPKGSKILFASVKSKPDNVTTIVSYLREWKPTLSLVAFDVAVGYLPHLWRNDEENVFSVMVGLINEMMVETQDQEVQKVDSKVLSMYKKSKQEMIDDDFEAFK
nr:hypothetical protein [Tanacetum cinerariifolium]